MKKLTLFAISVFSVALSGCSKPSSDIAVNQDVKQQPAAGSETLSTTTPPVGSPQASGKIRLAPAQPKQGEKVAVTMELKDQSGAPITDADVKAVFVMAMGSSQTREQAELKWNGKEYAGAYNPTMSGTWDVAVEARKNKQLLLSMPSTITVQ